MSLFPYGHISGMFIQAAPEEIANCLTKWGNEKLVGRSTSADRRRMTLDRAWEYLSERTWHPDRGFLIDAGRLWTAFFDNHRDEYLAQAEFYVLSKRLLTTTCFFSFNDAIDSTNRGSAQFCLNRFVGGQVQERQVILYKENPWVFHQSGISMQFEDIKSYSNNNTENRLSPEILKDYGRALNISFWDPDFYGQNVIMLNWNTKATLSGDEAIDTIANL
jgi:hypothetical protein